MAVSEAEGVPEGSVMIMQERPGETINVLPTHLLHSQIFRIVYMYFRYEATVAISKSQ